MGRRGRRHHHSRHHSHHEHRKHSNFKKLNYFSRKHPLVIAVFLIISSLILFRLSFTNPFLHSSEVFMWSIILSIGLFIAGFLVLIGWWRNHVSTLTTRHNVTWRNR
ncbi:MAG: Ycf66 family protein [Nanoarchaeota archaeon]